MKNWGIETLVILVAAIAIAALGGLVYLDRGPRQEPEAKWVEGAMSAPQETELIGVWIDRAGNLDPHAVERIGDQFYQAGPRGTAVLQYWAPPRWWYFAPRRAP